MRMDSIKLPISERESYKLPILSYENDFIHMQLKHSFLWMVVPQASFWKRRAWGESC